MSLAVPVPVFVPKLVSAVPVRRPVLVPVRRIPVPGPIAVSGDRRRRPGLGDFSAVANVMTGIEGSNPAGAGCNNPGNLTFMSQPGASPVTIGSYTWACFPTYDAGYQALLNQISLEASRGLTIEGFTEKYAPASAGNDPQSYAQKIAAAVGLSPDDPLSLADSSASSPVVASSPGSVDLSSAFSFLGPSGSVVPASPSSPTIFGVDPMTLALAGLALAAVWALS